MRPERSRHGSEDAGERKVFRHPVSAARVLSRRRAARGETAQPAGFRVARFGDDHGYSDIATRRLFGDSANVEALGNFDACLEAAADMGTVPMVPLNAASKRILCADKVPVAGRAGAMCLRALAAPELPAGHALASFGRLEEIKIVYSKDVALWQCSKFIERYGMKPSSTAQGSQVPLNTETAASHVGKRRVPYIAAICSEEAAVHHGVPIAQRSIANSPDNSTTFHAYVRADSDIPAPAQV